MSRGCDQELCPMWDGDGCPCDRFGLDRDDLPISGVFTVDVVDEAPDGGTAA